MGETDISRITRELEELLPENRRTELRQSETGEACRPEQESPEMAPEDMASPEPAPPAEKTKARKFQNRKQAGSAVRRPDGLVAAFAVPVVVLIFIFIQRGIFPFGDKSFLRTDMYHQYAPFFSEFRYKLAEGGSLLYSWDIGMGVNFSALYAYYLASPLNWLILLCPKEFVIEFMTYMIVLKTGLCGLSMAWYLRRHCGTQEFGVAFFGIFYALSGYMAAYSWNIMWLDCIVLFPLVLLGLERLVHEGKGFFYCITLGLSILSNYYISIMTCLFLVIYFVALLILEERVNWEKFVIRMFQFCIFSLLAGALAGVVLLPEIYALRMTASGDVSFPKTFSQYFPIFDMIARHIGNVETEIGLDHWPNLYCGVAVLALFVLYLLCGKISLKEKIVYCLMFLFFMASFSMNVLNFIWHGFHYPNSLPCRQSYIYICLMLTVCCRVYRYLGEMSRRQILGAFSGAILFVLLAQKLVTCDDFHFIVYYVAILELLLYLSVILWYRRGEKYHWSAMVAALSLVAVESASNMAITSITTITRSTYVKDNAAVERLVSTLEPASDFYRVEKVTRKTKNDGAWMHFPSVSLFSSTASADLTALFQKLGCEASTNAYSITGSTPAVDALFSVRYGLYSEDPPADGFKTCVSEDDGVWLYENRFVLPLGFVVDSGFEARWNLGLAHPADVQNSLADAAGTGPLLTLVTGAVTEGQSMTLDVEESGQYYAYVGNSKIDTVTVTGTGANRIWEHVNRGYFLELGYREVGDRVTLTADDSKESMWADIYRASESGTAELCEKLSEYPWRLTSWTDTALSGQVQAPESGGVLLTTIPWDEGWTVAVDGRTVMPRKMLDAFLGISLAPGEHTVELTYRPRGLLLGAGLTGAALLLLLAIAAAGKLVPGGLLLCGAEFEDEEDDAGCGEEPDFLEEDEDSPDDDPEEEDEGGPEPEEGNGLT